MLCATTDTVNILGLGVPRKMVKCMREYNGIEPQPIEEEERFTVRLLR